ncbi:Sodium/hydrogen exchanger 9B2 [Frankliniella fusca]|uniref:Sodium/hydrogen exchanger 9B2 n=1 Tax=Frankliniella fusca TaxID=407009 RepID=A0AAE1I046_9NEOP|nr:Sodium/hydrogen exchanger 9B2 [Frankliniella fusca]
MPGPSTTGGSAGTSTTPLRLPLGLLGGLGGGWRARSDPEPEHAPGEPTSPQEPGVRYQYTPPELLDSEDSGAEPRARRWAWLRCPRCPCVSRILAVLQECADGFGAWPSGRWVSSVLCPAVLLLQLWALAYCFLGDLANVDGPLFRLVAMFVCASLAGWMVHSLADVPALVGMLVVGVAFKNTEFLNIGPEYDNLISVLRKAALALIMVRAGLGLDPRQLRSLSLIVLGLAIVPALVEVASIVGVSYLLLDLPPLWGVLLGLVLCAVAPSVVMPCFVELRAQRLGTDKGIDTLVVAAASFDDVIAISLYGLVQSILFSGGTSAEELAQHPLGLLFGILYGAVLGKSLQLVPLRETRHLAQWRSALVLGGGLVVTFGSDTLGFHEAGSVGCIATAFTAAAGWRKRETSLAVDEVEKHFEVMWIVFEPIMFSLIGADINTSVLDGGLVGIAVGCILISLLFRTISTWLLLFGAKRFNWKERLFVALSWLPKADVQAALGPLALDAARHAVTAASAASSSSSAVLQLQDADVNVARANTVLLVAVLSILLTAPAGSIIISSLSKRLLSPAPPRVPRTPPPGLARGPGPGPAPPIAPLSDPVRPVPSRAPVAAGPGPTTAAVIDVEEEEGVGVGVIRETRRDSTDFDG